MEPAPHDQPPDHGAEVTALEARPSWSWWLEAGWTAAGAVALVAGLVAGSWFWAVLGGLVVIGGSLGLDRTRPAAVRERTEQEAVALAEWSPERLLELAAERRIDPTREPVALIAAVRKVDRRLSLSAAKRLVDGVRQS